MNDRPNILFLMPDQLRSDFLGCYGAGFAKTPHVDALAASGTRFERCLSPTPICVPARASLMTGGSSLETGVTTNGQWLRPDLSECGIETWPQALARAGYRTYGVGKMHFYPWDAGWGFDERAIAEDKRQIGIDDDYGRFLAEHGFAKQHAREFDGYHENGGACISPVPAELQGDAWCADRAIEMLRTHDPSTPFAMMVGFPSPHCPYDPPADIAALFDPADMPAPFASTPESEALRPWLVQNMKRDWADIDYTTFTAAQIAKVRAHYSALIHLVDRAVGRIMEALTETGLDDRTVIVFASDHGDFVGDFGLVCKNFFMEGSIRVPMILRLPGQEPQVRMDAVALHDVCPTFLHLAGLAPRAGLDARSLLARPDWSRIIAGLTHRGMMIERGGMKLARYIEGVVTLTDVTADPGDQANLAHDPHHAATRAGLEAELASWIVRETAKGHADKRVPGDATSTPGPVPEGDIRARGWKRPYPMEIS